MKRMMSAVAFGLSVALVAGTSYAQQRVEDRTQEQIDKAKDKLDRAGDKVEQKLDQAGDKINRKLDQAGDKIDQKVGEVKRDLNMTHHLKQIHMASNILGKNLRNNNNENLGEIKDLVLDHQGMIRYVVIGSGGILGIGESFLAIPWSAVKPDFQNKSIMMNITKDRLEAAPMFSRETYHKEWKTEWRDTVHKFFNAPMDDVAKPDAGAMANKFHYVTTIIGSKVMGSDQASLGSIKDILFDENAKAKFAVVSYGGVVGIGDKEVAVPWRAFNVRMTDENKAVASVKVTKAQMEAAPVLKQDHYADLLNETFAESTWKHFGVTLDRQEIETQTPLPQDRDLPKNRDLPKDQDKPNVPTQPKDREQPRDQP